MAIFLNGIDEVILRRAWISWLVLIAGKCARSFEKSAYTRLRANPEHAFSILKERLDIAGVNATGIDLASLVPDEPPTFRIQTEQAIFYTAQPKGAVIIFMKAGYTREMFRTSHIGMERIALELSTRYV